MKTFTSLAVLVALLFCSCKNHSFLSQRYTHYGHSNTNNSNKGVAVKHPGHRVDCKTEAAPLTQERGTKVEEPGSGFAAGEKTGTSKSPVATIDHPANSAGTVMNSLQAKEGATKAPLASRYFNKMVQKQKAAARHGLIFGVINLALFIVICALVVLGVIFLLIMLA